MQFHYFLNLLNFFGHPVWHAGSCSPSRMDPNLPVVGVHGVSNHGDLNLTCFGPGNNELQPGQSRLTRTLLMGWWTPLPPL